MNIVIIIGLAILVGILLALSLKTKPLPKTQKAEKFEFTRPCPLCGSSLKKGERVHSVIYPGEADRLIEVFGCKYCYPANNEIPRFCPVCKKKVKTDGYVVGRMFLKPEKSHLHINGCTDCMKKH